MSNWTTAMDARLAALADENLSSEQVAAQLGVTRNAVIGRARRIGVVLLRTQKHARTRQDDERDLRILDAIKAGESTLSAARRHRVPHGHVKRLVRDYPDPNWLIPSE